MTTFLAVAQLRFPVEFVASLQRMGDELPESAAIAHTWGDGYLVTAITGAATFNDGQDPDPVIEQLLDRALTDADPATLHDVVSFIARHGRGGIDATILQEQSYSGLLAQMGGSEPPESPPVYVLLSNRMIRGFGAIWEKGRWNFETNSGVREGYDVRSCETEAGVLRCRKKNKRDILVDVERGTVNGRRALARFVRIVDGRIAEERDYQDPLGMSMQLIETEDDEAATLHILKSPVFRSNFNQMFLLGRFDPTVFQEVHNDFPTARAFRILAPPQASSARPN
jgi:dolichyl-diphosphooligosaccharide--protein glycosyltransferase